MTVKQSLENILNILRHQEGNGADVHEVGNMQNVAKCTLELLADGYLTEDKAKEISTRLEKKLVVYLQKKYC